MRSRGLMALAWCLVASCQPAEGPTADLPVAARKAGHNPSGPPELAQYDFLAGDWDVALTISQPDGSLRVYRAQWHNRWIADGAVMMQEWRSAQGSGIELRSFNPDTRRWDGRNLYVPSPGTWYDNEAEQVGGTMVVTTHQKTPDGTPMISREIYESVDPNRFTIRTQNSRDGGMHWEPGRLHLDATRMTAPDTSRGR